MSDILPSKVTIVTHNGSFHADDVFGVAALTILCEVRKTPIKIIRSRDPKVVGAGLNPRERVGRTNSATEFISDKIVLDVGGVYDEARNFFDHHQIGGAGDRGNGVPYAAFGLIWKKFGAEISGDAEVAEKVDKSLVQFIDAGDNGRGELKPFFADVFPYTIEQATIAFNFGWTDEYSDNDGRFSEAVFFATGILRREIKIARETVDGEKFTRKAYEDAVDKRLIILEKNYPWREILSKYPEPLFVIEPASVGWHAKAVRDNPSSFVNRKNFPKEWAGRRDSELAAISGVSDAVFCPNALFVAFAKSKEGAIALAHLAIRS